MKVTKVLGLAAIGAVLVLIAPGARAGTLAGEPRPGGGGSRGRQTGNHRGALVASSSSSLALASSPPLAPLVSPTH